MKKVLLLLTILCLSVYAQAYDFPVLTDSQQLARSSLGSVQSTMQSEQPDLFGGIYIEHNPFRIFLLTTDINKTDELTKYFSNPVIFDYLEIIEVKYSAEMLSATQLDAMKLLKSHGIRSDSSVYIIENKINIRILEKDSGKNILENAIENNKVDSDMFDIKYIPQLSKPHSAIPYGGTPFLSSSGRLECTSSFHGYNLFGPDYVYTAGHCGDDPFYMNGEYFRRLSMNFGGVSDWSTRSSSNLTTGSSKIKTCQSGCLVAITDKKFRSEQYVGDPVCKYGASTYETCGVIVSTTAAPEYVPNVAALFIEVKSIDGDPMSAYGDSGGAYYSGTIGYGILSGGDLSSGNGYYMALNAATSIMISSN